MHRGVQQRVGGVVERTAHVGGVGGVGRQADPLGQRCRDRGAGEDRRAFVPHAGPQRWAHVERGDLELGVVGGPRHERHRRCACFGVAVPEGGVHVFAGPRQHRHRTQPPLLGVVVVGLDLLQHLADSRQPQLGIAEYVEQRTRERERQAPADERRQHLSQRGGEFGDRSDECRVVEDRPHGGAECDEPTGRQLDPDRVAHDVLDHVRLVEHDHLVFGDDRPERRHVDAVEVGVDHDHVGDLGPVAGAFGEAGIAHRALVASWAFVARHADRPPCGVGRAPIQLGGVADRGATRPLGEPNHFGLGDHRHLVHVEAALARRRRRAFAQALQAEVVGSPLEHRPVDVDALLCELIAHERQVLAGELILECLGGGHHDGALAGHDRRHEVRQRLAGAGSGLHHEVTPGTDRRLHEGRHAALTVTMLGGPQPRRDCVECCDRRARGIRVRCGHRLGRGRSPRPDRRHRNRATRSV